MKIYTLIKTDADPSNINIEVIASSTWKEEMMTRMETVVNSFYYDNVEEDSWDVNDYYSQDKMEWYINDFDLNTLFKIIESELDV